MTRLENIRRKLQRQVTRADHECFDQFDEEMNRRNVEAILLFGDTTLGNPDLTYVIGGNIIRGGVFFKRLGETPIEDLAPTSSLSRSCAPWMMSCIEWWRQSS